jgi:hypothetical protein
MSTMVGDNEQQERAADEGSEDEGKDSKAMGTMMRVVGERRLRGLVRGGGCCRMAPLLQGRGEIGGEAASPL